jgi:hypothetical protein
LEFLAILLLLVCYGLAVYLGWLQNTPIYLFTLFAGHLSALASPLWQRLYDVVYRADMARIEGLFGQPIPTSLLIGSGWYYTLPALIVFYLFSTRWWFPGAVTGVLTFFVFLLYHLLIESVGLRSQVWAYSGAALPLNFSQPLLAGLMSALISYGLLYALLVVHRSSWQSLLLAVLPAPLLMSLLVHGLLGAPLWAALALQGQAWALTAGLLSTLVLLAWCLQIITGGVRRLTP